MIHFTPLKLKIAISTPKTSVSSVARVCMGRIGVKMLNFEPNPSIASWASTGKPVELGKIPISQFNKLYAMKMMEVIIMLVSVNHET